MNTLNSSGKTSITIDGSTLLHGDYSVSNNDLIISTDSDTTLIKDYFVNLPILESPQGATLTPKLVSSLSAYNSNTLLGFEDPKAIGEITVTDGPIVITRLGQKIELNQGDFIYLNDLVDVGTMTVGITFKDDTALSLEPGAKMVVDEFYYDPEANQGGMNADVIGGSFSFVSGEIAKVGTDAMTVSTPVLTIGVRGTQVAGRANQEGEDNEIVLLPNQDGTVGEIAIKNDSGEVVLTQPYEATTITSSFVAPTVPVVLPKEVVLKKYAKTISTTRKTEKVKEVERETEEATKEKEEAEEEKEELEEEAEELEEEAEELEEEKEELEEEAEELEEEKEELEEEAEALEEEKEELEEEAEALEEEKEELEEAKEELAEEKEEIQEKAEELKEEIAELEEQLAEADAAEAEEIIEELEEAQQEIEEVEEVQQEIEEKFEEVEEKFEEVVAEEKFIEQKVEQVEEKVEEVQQEVLQVEEKFEEVQQEVIQVEEKFEEVKQEVIQIEQKVEFVEEKIVMVEEKFDAIVEEFEVFQQEFVQEFENYIPEEEIQQFIEEAPIELIEQFQEKVIQQLEEEQIEIQENIQEEEIEDIFAEEAVQEKLAEIEEKQEELIEKADDLMQLDMELQEQAQELEEEQQALEEEAEALEEAAEEAYANNDREAIEEIEEQYQELDRDRQELNEGFEELNEQYEELDENFEELNNEFFAMDEELQEVFQDGPMVVRVPEDGPGYNQDDDVFNVPDEQVIDLNVEEFLAEEKAQALQNNDFAVEADNFFNDQEIQEALPEDIDQNVQDMMVIQAGDLNEYFVGAGADINNVDDFYAEDPMEDFYNVVDNNEVLYEAERDAQDFMDDLIENIAVEQNINVAPWLDMPNDVTVAEANAKVAGTVVGYVYGTDANGDTLTYSIFDDPTGALSISGNTIIWDGTYAGVSQDTTYSVILKVQDPYGASDVDSFNITVTADTNDPTAWVTAGDGSAGNYKQTIAYVGSSTDGRDFITELGHSSVSFNGAIASNFNGYDAIVYYNQSNTSHSSSPFYNDTRFIDWVDDGGVFVMYDRYVNDSANDSKIPGHNGNVVTTRDAGNSTESGSYQIAYESTSNLLKYGPGGIMVDDTSTRGSDTAGDHSGNAHLGTFNIGGGNSTNHGYMSNFDSDVLGMATRANTDQYVDAVWEYGAGAVYYSTVPLDHYIGAAPSANGNDAWDAYALNSLHFATSLIFDGYSQLNGTGNSDKMYGTAADDVFWSKDGADEIWGGNGADTFLYTQTYQTDPGSHDTILDFNSSEDRIDISAITNGAGISRTLSNGTLFKIDSDNNGSYEMQWELDDYTGTADDVTVIT